MKRTRRDIGRCGGHGIQARSALALMLAVSCLSAGPMGCQPKDPPPAPVSVAPMPFYAPRYLRGTIGHEAEIVGYAPTLVQSFGLVAGLDGTGSRDTPIPIRAELERVALLNIKDTKVTDREKLNIQHLLDSEDTAVVIVDGIIPPGAPAGTRFDVRVTALGPTSTTSLEGGRLWSSRMSVGFATPGGPETDSVSISRGSILINPFAGGANQYQVDDAPMPHSEVETGLQPESGEGELEFMDSELPIIPGSTEVGSSPFNGGDQSPRGGTVVNLRVGRILSGGVTTQDMPLVLRLLSPSHSRARAMMDAVNSRFPQEPGQRTKTAVAMPGRSDERLVITMPPSYRNKTMDFVQTLRHTPIFPGGIEPRSNELVRWVKANPVDAGGVSWSWVALGPRAIPHFQSLYDYPEASPRLAALRAGAKLGDSLVVHRLANIARDRQSSIRVDAVNLLAELRGNPQVGTILRELIDDDSLPVRVAAFDGLRRQGDLMVREFIVSDRAEFELFSVPSSKPMIYATMQDIPRIVVFGEGLEIPRPTFVDLWSSRLLIVAESEDTPLRLQYRDYRGEEAVVHHPSTSLPQFVRFLGGEAGRTSSDLGLALSYSEIISTLYAMHLQGSLGAPLVPERDYLTEHIVTGQQDFIPTARQETSLTDEERKEALQRAREEAAIEEANEKKK